MRKIHIYDSSFAHDLCSTSGRSSKYIEWTRDPFGDTTFFTNDDILKEERNSINYAWLLESQAIVKHSYHTLKINKSLAKSFNTIFTHSTELLNKYENAVFTPGNGVWWGGTFGGGSLNEKAYELKTKNISMMCSDKTMCEMHRIRNYIAKTLKSNNKADVFGKFDGGPRAELSDVLLKHKYCVVVENFIDDYYFTEKLLDCFASMTVPIYIGATKISRFFNEHGIIQVDTKDIFDIENIIKICCEADYQFRLSAVKENFEEVKKYLVTEDYLYERYVI